MTKNKQTSVKRKSISKFTKSKQPLTKLQALALKRTRYWMKLWLRFEELYATNEMPTNQRLEMKSLYFKLSNSLKGAVSIVDHSRLRR